MRSFPLKYSVVDNKVIKTVCSGNWVNVLKLTPVTCDIRLFGVHRSQRQLTWRTSVMAACQLQSVSTKSSVTEAIICDLRSV